MRPNSASIYLGHERLAYAELRRDGRLRRTSFRRHSANRFHLRHCQFRQWAHFPAIIGAPSGMSSFPDPILLIYKVITEEKMSRTYTWRVIAPVQHIHSVRNIAVMGSPGCPVSKPCAFFDHHVAVTVRAAIKRPEPAPGRRIDDDVRYNPFDKRKTAHGRHYNG